MHELAAMLAPYPIHTFTRENSPLPPCLWQVPSPTLAQIHIQGSERALQLLQRLPEHGLAIVGTRNPQSRSIQTLQNWMKYLKGTPLIIVSGFARGIDTSAHRMALQINLPTIAILGAGLGIPYPSQNQDLRQQILAANGLLISEFSHQSEPLSFHFIRRNRLIAAWSKAVVIVEASHQSGALNTAKWARDQDRTCFAVPCFPGDPSLAGNQRLIDQFNAYPFWGAHSLGTAWVDFSTLGLAQPKKIKTSSSCGEEALVGYVNLLTAQQGGAPVQQLLDWAFSQGWDPQNFFISLQKAIQGGQLIDENGLLLKNPEVSD